MHTISKAAVFAKRRVDFCARNCSRTKARAAAVRHNVVVGWKEQLKNALDGITSRGTFAVTGTVDGPLPEMRVRGVGNLALPIGAGQARDLVFAGQPAPYGKGSKTVIDPAVRNAIQLEAHRVRFSKDWDETLSRLTIDVAAKLGLSGGGATVEARLYKLLVYERGGHFRAHRDTEKEPGMFGTLLVQLPVEGGHTGGTLAIRHLEFEVEWDTANGASQTGMGWLGIRQAQQALKYAAFYADCEHELYEVESGLRVVLAYNLVRVEQKAAAAKPAAASGGATGAAGVAATAEKAQVACPAVSVASLTAVTEAVRAWEAAGPVAQPMVALPLAHKYTEANLGFGTLKGDDGAKVQALLQCPLLDVHLVLFGKQVDGKGNMFYSYDGSDDEEQMESVDWNCIDVKACVSPLFGELPDYDDAMGFGRRLEDSLLAGDKIFPNDLKPDNRKFTPYTGNEGPRLTYWYHRALVVAWPRSRRAQLAVVPGSIASAVAVAKQCLSQLRGSGGDGGGGGGDVAAAAAGATAAAAPPAAAHTTAAAGAGSSSDAPSTQWSCTGGAHLQQYLQQLEERQPHQVDDSRKQADAELALQAVLDCAVKAAAAPKQEAEGEEEEEYTYYSNVEVWQTGEDMLSKRAGEQWPTGELALQALALLSSPAPAELLGKPWQQHACVQVVQSMAAAAVPPAEAKRFADLMHKGLPAVIASAAATLASTAFDDAVVELVARQAPQQLQGCYQLLVQEALPKALRERMVQAFNTAVFGGTEVVAAGAAGSGTAAAAAVPSGGGGCIAQLQPADVCFLAGLVFATAAEGTAGGGSAAAAAAAAAATGGAAGGAAPCRGMAGAFTAAVLRRGDCQALLQALLKEEAVRQALSTQQQLREPAALQLAVARAQYLEPRVLPGPPEDDLSMPGATSNDARVTNFLRSPDTAREFSGFHSVANALRWAHDVVKGDGRYGRAHAIQTVAVVGTDDDAAAVVVMTKHRGMNMQRLALYKAEAEELAELQALLG